MKISLIWFLFVGPMFLLSCVPERQYESPSGYDLTKPDKIRLSDRLIEISGITFLPGNQQNILAINDEEGRIYDVPIHKGKEKSYKFSNRGDYEDITACHDMLFILKSNGTLYRCNRELSKEMSSTRLETNLPDGDYESLFADTLGNKLYMLCKTCREGSKHNIQGYVAAIENDSTLSSFTPFRIERSDAGQWPANVFMPAGLAYNGITHEWFIISAASKLLLVADDSWKVKGVYHLNPAVFHHPEGIAFDDQGNLYISNEGDRSTVPNIVMFTFKPPTR